MALQLRVFAEPTGGEVEPANTLERLAKHYEGHLRERVAARNYSPRRMSGTMAYVRSFLRHVHTDEDWAVRIGELVPEQAKQAHLASWLVANFARWRKGSTRADALGAVLGCFNWLEENEFINRTAFRRPKKMKFPRVHRRAMRKPHYRAVVRAARKCPGSLPFRVIFFAAWHAGVRLSEFRTLEPKEIDWQAGLARLPASKHKTGGATGDERIIGLGPRLLAVLRRLVDAMKPGQKYVFTSRRGRAWTKDNLGRRYAGYRELAGVPEEICLCAVRHGCAVRLLKRGETNKQVADLLGHKSTRMVDSIYGAETRYEGEMLRALAARNERGGTTSKSKPTTKTAPAATPLFDLFE